MTPLHGYIITISALVLLGAGAAFRDGPRFRADPTNLTPLLRDFEIVVDGRVWRGRDFTVVLVDDRSGGRGEQYNLLCVTKAGSWCCCAVFRRYGLGKKVRVLGLEPLSKTDARQRVEASGDVELYKHHFGEPSAA